MLKKAHERITEIRSAMRGGEGTVHIAHLFQEELPGKCRLMAHITLPEGCSIGFHPHERETEVYYFLKGTGAADDNGEEKPIAPGDAMLTGGSAGHSVRNTGKGDLEFIAVIILE